ncbi:MAG: hypothetical protein GY771_00445 [bacterium]|nr:hypothetical protein [bacterium]
MPRASFKVAIPSGEAETVIKKASGCLESIEYYKAKSNIEKVILYKKSSGWPVVPKYIELSLIITEDSITYLNCEGYIPIAIFHETFKIGELPFTDKPTLTINVIRKEGYRDLMALKEHLMG